ncbi:MAG TPA: YfhO family protein, partial [Gracilimonas sp.]|nr:YfhO family protein [Gracilimonas sp.]
SDSTSTLEITNYTGPEITLEISRNDPGFLVLSEVYYPAGWSATLNGEEIPIYKTNYFLRGLEIPAGKHQIELRFEPHSYTIGTTLAWISLSFQVLLAGFLVFRIFKK